MFKVKCWWGGSVEDLPSFQEVQEGLLHLKDLGDPAIISQYQYVIVSGECC